MLRCSDGSYHVGTTRTSLEIRVAQHNAGTFQGYTGTRRPVELIFSQWFDRIDDAIENERKLKKWSRAKKEALIRGDFASLQQLAKRKTPHLAQAELAKHASKDGCNTWTRFHPSRRAQERAPQDEVTDIFTVS